MSTGREKSGGLRGGGGRGLKREEGGGELRGTGGGCPVDKNRMRVHWWLDICKRVCMHYSTYIAC